MVQYEWIDKTGLRHPSLVKLDVTGLPDELAMSFKEVLDTAPVLEVQGITNFDVCFSGYVIQKSRLGIPRGYEFLWFHKEMSHERYALFAGLRRKETASE